MRRVLDLGSGFTWTYDNTQQVREQQGGLYFGRGSDGAEVVIKVTSALPDHLPNEVQVARGLVGRTCTNVIRVFDADFDRLSAQAAVVMERGSERLRDTLRRHGQYSEIDGLSILLELLNGLVELGDVVHCDLKPENVMNADGRWKIIDFGSARLESVEAARPEGLIVPGRYTPHYAAPEQIHGYPVSKATDLYALGCVAYEVFSGSPPFNGLADTALREAQCYTVPNRLDAVHPELADLIEDMLDKYENRRLRLLNDLPARLGVVVASMAT